MKKGFPAYKEGEGEGDVEGDAYSCIKSFLLAVLKLVKKTLASIDNSGFMRFLCKLMQTYAGRS
jgi:hypothetical protein